MSIDKNALAAALWGTSPEGIALKRVIDSALERWTGVEVTPDKGTPILRAGKVHYESSTLLGQGIVEKLMRAAAIEGKADLLASLERLRTCEIALRTALDTYANLDLLEKLGTWRPKRRETLERRVIDALDPWVAFPTASEAVLETLSFKVAEVEEKLAKFPAGAGRPRNEAAHRVALQLAELYAGVTARKPTYSESRDGLHGEFTPVLRAVFDALGWKGIALRGPAEAAVSAIKDEYITEITRPRTMLFGGLISPVPTS